MSFENDLRTLIGIPVSQAKYIFGSIFHLHFATALGEAELVCNGCQWAVFRGNDDILLHDEAALSSETLSHLFAGKRLRSADVTESILTLGFDDIIFHAFLTEDYHLYLHDGVALGSPEWMAMTDAARQSFMLFRPGKEAEGYEFSTYCDLAAPPWGAAYLAAQEAADG
ncbi:hypothetical protein [Neorhizobium sp. DT-125]|uniref:hypothetical protein n=1 Tax=Neorhizobium sp. DT-125 TaxID=3396163 RepID=UPI003F192DA9